MRTYKLAALAALALSTAACVESVDQGYGYSNGYYAPEYASGGYYAQPTYYAQPSYYAPTQVVTQTRYVPVPQQHEANRSNDRRWDGNRAEGNRIDLFRLPFPFREGGRGIR